MTITRGFYEYVSFTCFKNIMAIRKRQKGQTMIYKTLQKNNRSRITNSITKNIIYCTLASQKDECLSAKWFFLSDQNKNKDFFSKAGMSSII
jgi:hypothetical protein